VDLSIDAVRRNAAPHARPREAALPFASPPIVSGDDSQAPDSISAPDHTPLAPLPTPTGKEAGCLDSLPLAAQISRWMGQLVGR
jgi:hypothetical protein